MLVIRAEKQLTTGPRHETRHCNSAGIPGQGASRPSPESDRPTCGRTLSAHPKAPIPGLSARRGVLQARPAAVQTEVGGAGHVHAGPGPGHSAQLGPASRCAPRGRVRPPRRAQARSRWPRDTRVRGSSAARESRGPGPRTGASSPSPRPNPCTAVGRTGRAHLDHHLLACPPRKSTPFTPQRAPQTRPQTHVSPQPRGAGAGHDPAPIPTARTGHALKA